MFVCVCVRVFGAVCCSLVAPNCDRVGWGVGFGFRSNKPDAEDKSSFFCSGKSLSLTHNTTHHSTRHHSTSQHSTQHHTAQHSTAHNITAQHTTSQHTTSQHSTAQHGTAQHTTSQHTHHTAHHITAQSQHLTHFGWSIVSLRMSMSTRRCALWARGRVIVIVCE